VITFIDPALPIVDGFTINYSIKVLSGITGGQFVVGTWSTPEPGDTAGSQIRVELQTDGSGGLSFFFFDATSFNSGSQGGFSLNTTYDCEFSVGGGQFRFFVNGVTVFSAGSSASSFVRLAMEHQLDGDVQIDELRVTDQVEHTADYAVSLPFCVCG
jgi:hypothetical protein